LKNVVQRLLLFFLGLPILVGIVLLLPQAKHGAIVVIILVFTGGSGIELARLYRQRGIAMKNVTAVAISLAAPVCAYVGSLLEGAGSGGGGPFSAIGALSLGGALATLVAFAPFAFVSKDGIEAVIARASALGFVAIYPGILGAFVVLIASEPPRAAESLLCFCILIFGNDSLAWLAGTTIGRTRGIVAVSPNKSLAGFIAGMTGSMGLALICPLLFPESMNVHWSQLLALGAVVGAAGIIGDLFESALKRSAGTKDSGNLVPGRGGFLDSYDSLLFAAPFFYGLTLLMGLFR
jgi:phosphatidate cytidylyltransferase